MAGGENDTSPELGPARSKRALELKRYQKEGRAVGKEISK